VRNSSAFPSQRFCAANYYGKGTLLVTQYRLIILPSVQTPRFSSLTLPLACIAPADFTMTKPLLSADYCSGKAVPVSREIVNKEFHWELFVDTDWRLTNSRKIQGKLELFDRFSSIVIVQLILGKETTDFFKVFV